MLLALEVSPLTSGLATLTSTLIELILVDHELRSWQAVIPKDDETLKREPLRTFLTYLGIEPKSSY